MQKGLQYTHAANKAAQGERIGGHHGNGSLTNEGDVMGGMPHADAANGIADVDLLG